MGAADCAFSLWGNYLSFNPEDPTWANRDRFILSAGHGSMLLYSLLHLFGYDLSLDELKNFRQWGSKTPGHPEFGHTVGVEVTTGPLGQGFANGVGMGIAARMAAERFNTDAFKPIDHTIYTLLGDGCLQEGISYEAAALAGHLKLGNLVYIYDSNSITIEGATDLAWSEDVAGRFTACGWHVQSIDGHDYAQITAAIAAAKAETGKPSIIIATTQIAFGSPKCQGSSSAHGSPLGAEEIAATRKNLGWGYGPFEIPNEVLAVCRAQVAAKKATHAEWQCGFAAWRTANPEKARLWDQMWSKQLPANLADELLSVVAGKDGATRALSGAVLQKAAALVPSLVGGSADLAPSNNSDIKGSPSIQAGAFAGRNLHYGVREHAMGAVVNGMALYGCFIPYGATFLVFSDYCRPTIRLSALMNLQSLYIFTHDSFFVGEDGPTHQPIEHVASLRLIPNLQVIRPADGVETAMMWVSALQHTTGPTAMILTRQKLPVIARAADFNTADVLKGGYVVVHPCRCRRGDHGQRLRGACGSRGGGDTGCPGYPGPHRIGALPGAVHGAAPVLPGCGPAGRYSPCGLRGRAERILGTPDRLRRSVHRHRALRRLGPGQGPGRAVRLHGTPGGGEDQGIFEEIRLLATEVTESSQRKRM